jgi:hypothetical protein
MGYKEVSPRGYNGSGAVAGCQGISGRWSAVGVAVRIRNENLGALRPGPPRSAEVGTTLVKGLSHTLTKSQIPFMAGSLRL